MKSINRIVLTDPHRATTAGEWCAKHLKHSDWQLNTVNIFSPGVRYEFGFFDTKHAMEFALRFV